VVRVLVEERQSVLMRGERMTSTYMRCRWSRSWVFRACPAITFVHKEGRICRRVDADLGFTGRVQVMDQKEAVAKLTKPVDNPRIDRRSSW